MPPGKERKSHKRKSYVVMRIVSANAYSKISTMNFLFMVSVLFLILLVQGMSLVDFIKTVVVLILLCLLAYQVSK